MRMTVAHRQGVGGSDEGLTFDITTAGAQDEGKRILRFDCFYKNPHYHVGASGEHVVHNMKDEGTDVFWWMGNLDEKSESYRDALCREERERAEDRLRWLLRWIAQGNAMS